MIGRGFGIGRLRGINIRIDWSWFIIALLMTWNLLNIFSQTHPEWNGGLRLGLAMLTALLFFASVLAHEMAHSVVAQAQGVPVRNITLFLLGGAANIQREPPSAKAEFLIAAAGPLMSLVIGALLFGVGLASAAIYSEVLSPGRMIAGLSPASTLLLWLGSINLVLAVFNMIPGFPLDGGRVLRSVLWAVTKNLSTATLIAAWIGRLIAWVMITLGVLMLFGISIPFMGTGTYGGVWMIFIGWFLNNASVQSYRQVTIQKMLENVTVERLMRRDPPTAEAGSTVADLVNSQMLSAEEPAFPVMENDELVGMVTIEDVKRVPRERWNWTTVREAMTPSSRLVTVRPEECANAVIDMLIQRELAQVPVIASNCRLVGLLRQRDIALWLRLNSRRRGQ